MSTGHQTANLEAWDIVTLVAYFVIVIGVGIWASFKANRGTSKGFFLAEKSMTWLPIAGSIFATNVSAQMFVGLAGTAAATGFAPVMFEWHATYMLVLLGWVFVPIYIACGSFTMPEYLRKRFGGKRLRIYYAITSLALIILNGISTEMYAGSLFIEQLLGWNLYASVGVILLITAVYTTGGGLSAVIYTDAIQTVILVVGSIVLSILVMDRVGGYDSMVQVFPNSAATDTYVQEAKWGNITCGFPPDDAFHILRDVQSDYPWPGLIFGLTLLATYYFCTNQTIVQRNLAAKDVSHSKGACVIASYLKILPFFLFVWPGMASRILYPDEVGCSDPVVCNEICGNAAGCTNVAYPLLVLRELPVGLRGLMLAALLAALMSSLTSLFNSASTIFTMDLWHEIRPKAGDFENVLVGRLFGLLMVGLSIAWLPVLQMMQGGNLWDYLQAISSYITPAWVVVFLLGMFWPRCTERGAWWGLMVGLVTGMARMGIHFAYPTPSCGDNEPDNRPPIYTEVHYLHFAIILAVVTLMVVVPVSYMTEPRSPKKLRRVTWWTRKAKEMPELTSSEEVSDEEPEKPTEEDINTEPPSCAKKTYDVCCGAPSQGKMSKEDKLKAEAALTDISEDSTWSFICDVNAVLAIAITGLLIGFYA